MAERRPADIELSLLPQFVAITICAYVSPEPAAEITSRTIPVVGDRLRGKRRLWGPS